VFPEHVPEPLRENPSLKNSHYLQLLGGGKHQKVFLENGQQIFRKGSILYVITWPILEQTATSTSSSVLDAFMTERQAMKLSGQLDEVRSKALDMGFEAEKVCSYFPNML